MEEIRSVLRRRPTYTRCSLHGQVQAYVAD